MSKLTEARQKYATENSTVAQKWSRKLIEVNNRLTALGQPKMNDEKKYALARILENTQNILNYQSLKEATQNFSPTGYVNSPALAVGPYKRYAIDIISAMVPSLIAFDVVAVQPIENKIGIINYVKYSAGSNKSGYNPSNPEANNLIADTWNYYGGKSDYTSANVSSESLAPNISGNTVTTSLSWTPIIIDPTQQGGNLSISIGTTVVARINATSQITNIAAVPVEPVSNSVATVSSGTVNLMTGAVSLTFSADPSTAITGDGLFADYVYDNQWAPAEVPELNLSIDSIPIQAVSRKLKALWSFDASYELQKEYSEDINALLAAEAAGEIGHEIDSEILNDLLTGAYTSPQQPALSWNATPPTGVSQIMHFESLKTVFSQGSNRIFQNTKRAVGNFVVCGTDVATVIESVPSFTSANSSNVIGPHFLGTWGGFKIYKDPFYQPNQFLVGYKGTSMFDAGYVYAPYMPVVTTPMVMLDDFVGRQGWATSYGKKMLNSYMYVPGSITGLNNFIQG